MKRLNLRSRKAILISLFSCILPISCNRQPTYSTTSRATGWQMSGTRSGYVNSTDKIKRVMAPGLIFIEGGTFTMGRIEDDVMGDYNSKANQQHVMSFAMDETEVTNSMYLEYLEWTKKIFPPNEPKYKEIYNGILPDTLAWRNKLGYNEGMVKNYLRHPAYAEYPVVGVNWIQAVEFCKWRTDRVNEASLEKNGYLKKDSKTNDVTAGNLFSTETYLNAPTMSYGGNTDIVLKGAKGVRKMPRKKVNGKIIDEVEGKEEIGVYAQRATGIIFPEYRLPTEAEWEYAALANVGQREFNNYKGKRKYPWSGKDTRAKQGKNIGDQLANFKEAKGNYSGLAGWSSDNAGITNKVKSYAPNDLGLYDMAGNVAEWVADIYRPIIDNETNDFNYFRGNIYLKNKKNSKGSIQLVTKETMSYDTLSNGKLIARDYPGEIIQIPIDDNETFLRRNFDKSYEVNYRDGDFYSKQYNQQKNSSSTKGKNSRRMYNSPNNMAQTDNVGNIIKIEDKSVNRTTLISDKTRVYKGGSWKDRSYWQSPSQRRYFSQESSSDHIGFRCAMSIVGAKAVVKKSRKN